MNVSEAKSAWMRASFLPFWFETRICLSSGEAIAPCACSPTSMLATIFRSAARMM